MAVRSLQGDVLGSVDRVAHDRFRVAGPEGRSYWLLIEAIWNADAHLTMEFAREALDRYIVEAPARCDA